MSRAREGSVESMAPSHLGELDIDDPTHRLAIFYPAVQSLTNALGGYEEVETSPGKYETVYRPGDSILAVLKDLKKLWRKDDSDDERTVARCMHRSGLMRELIAILVEMTDRRDWGRKVALVACDLIAALTWPIDVAQELKEMADGPAVVTDYASLLRAQQEYKAMLLQTNAPLRCLLSLMLPSLANTRKEEKDERVISLGLHIVRNMLSIKDVVATSTTTGEKEEMSRLQSNLILQLNKLTFFQLFLTLASCAEKTIFNQYNVLVLDILYLVYRGLRPKDLVKDQARAPMDQLADLLEKERKTKALGTKSNSTRHSRFGTTIQVKAGDQKLILHKQNAIHVNPGKILDEGKKKRAQRIKQMDDLTQLVRLDPDAMRVLQSFAKDFLKSCFNTFFASVVKDIRMERSKVRPSDNIRTLYLAAFFMEYLLALRRKELDAARKRKGNGTADAADEEGKRLLPLGLVGEMAEMDSVRWVVMRMKFSMEERPPAWTELQASIDCFTQILLLIDAMAVSKLEEDLEVAEILQHQLYYNGDVLDSSLEVVAKYKDQSIGYLDSVIHFAYVLLRMLERYSKTKTFMFVRKRKAARKKRKVIEEQGSLPEDYDGENEEDIQAEKDMPSYAEHAFTFTSFEKRFAQEHVVNTLLTYLTRFQEFEDPEQMKRVVGLMHRQVVRSKAEGLYFRIGPLNLFRQILDQRESLPKSDASNDLIQIINYILRKFFKKVAEDPFIIFETLGPKSRNKWKDLSSYRSDEEGDDGMGGQGARIREKMGPAELEFKKKHKLSWSQQMEVVVAVLLEAQHSAWIDWVIEVLEIALASRQEIVISVDGMRGPRDGEEEAAEDERGVRHIGVPSKEALDKFTQFDLPLDKDEYKSAVSSDPHLRLMLQLVSFERTFDDMTEIESWSLPAKILPSNLSTSIGALKQYLVNPPSLENDPKQLIQKKRKRRPRLARGGSDDEDEDDGGLPRQQRQRKKKVAEVQNYKSAAFIDDSDDEDEDADRAFFEKEKQLRERMMRVAEEQAGKMMRDVQEKKQGKKGKGKGKAKGPGDDEAEDGASPSKQSGAKTLSGEEEEQSASSSDDDSSSDDEGPRKGSRRQRKRRRSSQPTAADDSDEEADKTRSAAALSEEMIGSDSD